MAFSNFRPQEWADLADLARIARDEEPLRPTLDDAEIWRAEEDEEIRLALSVSKVTTEQADLDRDANAEAERQQILEAQRQSEREALSANEEREAMRKAVAQSRSEERARIQAERAEKKAVHKAIMESNAVTERERKRNDNLLPYLQTTYAVDGLTEDEHLELAIIQSQDEDHSRDVGDVEQLREAMLRSYNEQGRAFVRAGEQSAAQFTNGQPVLGAMASYPPSPITEQEQRSLADVQEFIENPNALFRPLTPIAETLEFQLASPRSAAGIRGQDPTVVSSTVTNGRNKFDERISRPLGVLPSPAGSLRAESPARLPSYHALEENPALRVEPHEVPHSSVLQTQIHGNPSVHPDAYPSSPWQANLATGSLASGPISEIGTPTPPGTYPMSYASSEVPCNDAGSKFRTPSQGDRVARCPLSNGGSGMDSLALESAFQSMPSIQERSAEGSNSGEFDAPMRIERFPGACPPPSQANLVSSGPGSMFSEGTFVTAREMQPPHQRLQPQPDLLDLWHHGSGRVRRREPREPRPSTPLSTSSHLSEATSAVGQPSSHTSSGSVTRKPVVASGTLASTHLESTAPAPALDVTTPPVAVKLHSQRDPVQYHFYGPVTVNHYNVPEDYTPSSHLLKRVLNKGTKLTKGMKVFEHKNGAAIALKGIAEATNAALENGAAFWRKKSNQVRVVSPSMAAHDAVSEVGEIDRIPASQSQDDAGSIANTLPAIQQLFCTNPDPSRSTLNTPETRRSLCPELPARQSVDLAAHQVPFLQESSISPQLPTRTHQRHISPSPSTESMISDVNGDAVTPPSDRQSGLTSSIDDSNFLGVTIAPDSLDGGSTPRPLPLAIRERPPPVSRKPSALSSPSTRTQPPPPRSRNPMTRRMPQGQEERAQWLQRPVHFPVPRPTQGPTLGSPDSMTTNPATPRRVTADLNRRSQHAPIDTDLANVPPGERRIDEFNSRSMMDLGRMTQVGDPESMAVLQGQYEQTYDRAPQERQERQTSDARARMKEKETQKYLRRQV